MCTTTQIVTFIKNNPQGVTFGQIQAFICAVNGLDYNETAPSWDLRKGEWVQVQRRKYRGYFVTALVGTRSPFTNRRIGILEKYCTKIGKLYFIK